MVKIKMDKQAKEQIYFVKFAEVLVRLHKQCPELISLTGKPEKLFTLGIHNDITALLGISLRSARLFCDFYCNDHYNSLLIKDAPRFNLKGEIVSLVTEEQTIFNIFNKKRKKK